MWIFVVTVSHIVLIFLLGLLMHFFLFYHICWFLYFLIIAKEFFINYNNFIPQEVMIYLVLSLSPLYTLLWLTLWSFPGLQLSNQLILPLNCMRYCVDKFLRINWMEQCKQKITTKMMIVQKESMIINNLSQNLKENLKHCGMSSLN